MATRIQKITTEEGPQLTPEKVGKAFNSFYQELYNLPNQPNNPETYFKNKKMKQLSAEQVNSINKPFTELEIKEAIDTLKKNKTPGPDGYPNIFYKQFKEELALHLKNVFNKIVEEKVIPEEMLYANIIPIHKPEKPPDQDFGLCRSSCTVVSWLPGVFPVTIRVWILPLPLIDPSLENIAPANNWILQQGEKTNKCIHCSSPAPHGRNLCRECLSEAANVPSRGSPQDDLKLWISQAIAEGFKSTTGSGGPSKRRRAEPQSSSSGEDPDLWEVSDDGEEEVEYAPRSLDSKSIDRLITLLRDTLSLTEEKSELREADRFFEDLKPNRPTFPVHSSIRDMILQEWNKPERKPTLKIQSEVWDARQPHE
ncbi:uncharacterized protein LOC134586225 [Pelobates fuscus]|uniref:uncharacterized protein LOC134586225 n=1 Tax=Pelobates fuscus TaxID=191477 RepID=UPI002FE4A3FF